MAGRVRIERKGEVAWILFENRERRNAMSVDMWKVIPEAARQLDEDPAIRAVVLRGAGEEAFVAGADLSEFPDEKQGAGTSAYGVLIGAAFAALENIGKPVLAAIHGPCVGGGCAIALCADLRFCAQDAVFAIPALRLGIGYGADGIEKLARVVGEPAAREILLTGRHFDSAEAAAMKLVNRVLPKLELDDYVRSLAESVAANAPLAVRATKNAFIDIGRPEGSRRRDAVEQAVAACLESDDYREGVRAFLEKRRPEFRGR